LPELWKQIGRAPILGSGFGTTVTYQTSDPRLLRQNPDGRYTTYAFEWGWLDIWLKLGFFGLLAHLSLFIWIIAAGYKKNTWLSIGLGVGLLLIIAVSVFTPYSNHPLGIGFLFFAAAAIAKEKNGSCACS
jgi:O-antigen ligase